MTVETVSVVSSAITSTDITLYLSVAAAFISLATFIVGYSQMKIASAKTRLDLYNKRFEVYKAALDYHNAIWFGDYEKVKNVGDGFIKYYRESKFLFEKESGVYAILEQMKNSGAMVRGAMQQELLRIAGAHDNADQLGPLSEACTKARNGFEALLEKLEDEMEEYLKFHNVSGWTFF
ncbi:hypothetical protein PMM47T1_23347 [Pseudomonas sp. M47T1]|uniref:hypothetical protein n=1 Tax=Pseudomonas sp. M47T1 TaxID=1179778 RepID=UPI0002607665|nr:hypothetical protein [Pseudomonas sp. M47T1]EIK94201.1 hypothetical protein PMM47T1_23347 [Pseudomonas sp. M47T1]